MGRKTFTAPVFIVAGASQATVLETSSAAGAIPQTSDIDSNPGAPGPTRTKVLDSSPDIVSQNVGGMKVVMGFASANLTTSMATTAINAYGLAANNGNPVAYAGSILGIATSIDTHAAAGGAASITVWPTKNGTTVAALKVVYGTVAGTLTKTATQNKDTTTLVAGDRIGVKVLTSASLTAGLDLIANVYVDQ